MSSTSDKLIQRRMLGNDASECARMRWSDDQISVLIFSSVGAYCGGFSQEAYFKCEQINSPLNAWNCKHLKRVDEKQDLSHKAWVTLTDDNSYSFVVRCFPKIKQTGWVLFTTSESVSPELKSKVLDHAKSLGYGTNLGKDYIMRPYKSCGELCLK